MEKSVIKEICDWKRGEDKNPRKRKILAHNERKQNATAMNERQLGALANEVEDQLAKEGVIPKNIEGRPSSGWLLMDYGDVVVHIFSKEDRLFYDLERIWRDGRICETV